MHPAPRRSLTASNELVASSSSKTWIGACCAARTLAGAGSLLELFPAYFHIIPRKASQTKRGEVSAAVKPAVSRRKSKLASLEAL